MIEEESSQMISLGMFLMASSEITFVFSSETNSVLATSINSLTFSTSNSVLRECLVLDQGLD
jgi:hypothetical protein